MGETQQQDFKLLAIQPIEGCHSDFRKVLKEGEIYSFYPSYQFSKDSKGEVFQIKAPKDEPRLYDIDGLSINISAVVGKNGSGKSALTEMLYYFNYCLGISLRSEGSIEKRILPLNFEELLKEEKKNKQEVNESHKSLLVLKGEIEQIEVQENNSKRMSFLSELIKEKLFLEEKINQLSQTLGKIEGQIPIEKKAYAHIRENFKVSIFYQLKGGFYELRFNRNLYMYSVFNGERISLPVSNAVEVLENFFYTISINYSHYALNSNFIGNWINTLFHKNDAYHAPIVINPRRVEGNFDINDENNFALNRLLYNVLIEKLESSNENVKITDNQYVEKVRFQLNPSKSENGMLKGNISVGNENDYAINLIIDLQDIFFGDTYLTKEKLSTEYLPYQEEIYNYIIRKLQKISRTYSIYGQKGFNIRNYNSEKSKYFLNKLKNDNSHITFKLKQAINFLRVDISKKIRPWSVPTGHQNGLAYFDLTLKDLLLWMNYDSKNPEELINYLPPSIFTIDILLSRNSEDANSIEELPRFSALSSGEQQMIHSVQSVLYHLNNLQSAHSGNDGRQTYEAVNIIYDEIELYFHPEYQRKFVNQFLSSISRLDLGRRNGIKNINILFSTHSPFVLSDIPDTSILRLNAGKQKPLVKENKTFGANIYTLLKDSFFLENYIGEHARGEIQKLINSLQSKSNEKSSEFVKEVLDEPLENLKKRIELIGEPFLREKLWEKYYDKFGLKERIAEMEKEIERLKENDL